MLLRLPIKTHIWVTLSDEKSRTMLPKALKIGFVENKGQSGSLSAVSKTQDKCQLSVKFSTICHLSVGS